MSAETPNRKVILIVEDDTFVREVLVDILIDEGYRVVEAETADEALQRLENCPAVRLVLTDIQMPGELNRIDLAWQVRSRWPSIASLVTSGRLRPGSDELPPEVRFLAKPWKVPEMLRQVSELVA